MIIMTRTELFNAASRMAHKLVFETKKKSPAILIVGGVLLGATCVVTACKASRKLDKVLEETKDDVDAIHAAVESSKLIDPVVDESIVPYTEKDAKRDLAKAYTKCAGKLVKLYAGPVCIGVLGTASILTGANILHSRNLALAAAYTSVSETFNRYSKNVIERFGEDTDRELRYDIKAKEIIETITNEDGSEVTTATVVEEANVLECDTDKFFDEFNIFYTDSAELNLNFLLLQQSLATEKLVRNGHLFLNDVYEMVGIKPTVAGQSIGWIYDKKNPVGDNYVDFGLGNPNSRSTRLFVNGHENAVLLHFNHDGNILNKKRKLFELH
jgi:hypothetical protein